MPRAACGEGCEGGSSRRVYALGRVLPLLASLRLLSAVLLASLSSSCCRYDNETALWKDVFAAPSPVDPSCFAILSRTPDSDSPSLGVFKLPEASPATSTLDASAAMRPVFSPDGRTVYFMRRGVFHMLLLSVPTSGGEPAELASLRVSPQHLRCLPAKDSIVFVCFMEGCFGASSSLKVFDMASGSLREVRALPGAAISSAAISADGRVFVYSDGRGLWRVDLSEAQPSAVSLADKIVPLERPLQFALSADGSLLALRLGRLERRNEAVKDGDFSEPDLAKIEYKTFDMRRLAVVDLAGGKPVKTIASESSFRLPAFSPDAKRLAFIDGARLRVADLETGRIVSRPCPGYEFGEQLDWLDSKSLLFQVFEGPRRDARIFIADAACEAPAAELAQGK